VEGKPIGMAVSSFASVSLTPPLVSVCVGDSSATWPKLRGRPVGLSVLAEDQIEQCRALSRKDADRFAGLSWQASAEGALFVDGAVAWFDCAPHAEINAGDHAIVLLEIRRLRTNASGAPLVFHSSRFRRLDDAQASGPS
jgi:flavin reductase (DIM6/NTAB) family NADH-FMN oxidoreductase RutF